MCLPICQWRLSAVTSAVVARTVVVVCSRVGGEQPEPLLNGVRACRRACRSLLARIFVPERKRIETYSWLAKISRS